MVNVVIIVESSQNISSLKPNIGLYKGICHNHVQPCGYAIAIRKFENNLTTKVENKEILITKLGGTF